MKFLTRLLFLSLLVSVFITLPTSSSAQVLRKLKEKAVDKILGTEKETTKETPTSTTTSKGKKLTPPDVNMHLTEATAAVNNQNYNGAKFNIQQAITGVELEIGYAILESAPTSVNGAAYVPAEDQVASTGIGFVGLTIGRKYQGNKKEVNFGVVNNSALVGAYGMMLNNANYSSSEGEQKAISLDGNRGIIKYENGDYELGVPLGTNSIFVLNCKGFEDENEVMAAARLFNVNEIKKMLGEQ